MKAFAAPSACPAPSARTFEAALVSIKAQSTSFEDGFDQLGPGFGSFFITIHVNPVPGTQRHSEHRSQQSLLKLHGRRDGVPELEAGLQRFHGGLGGLLLSGGVARAKQIDHLAAHLPVLLPIQCDVAVKVIA